MTGGQDSHWILWSPGNWLQEGFRGFGPHRWVRATHNNSFRSVRRYPTPLYQHTGTLRLGARPHTNPFPWRTVCFSGRAPGPKRGGLVPNVMSATLGGASARRAAPAVHTLAWGATASSSFRFILNHNSSHHGSASSSQFCLSHACDLPHGCGYANKRRRPLPADGGIGSPWISATSNLKKKT